MKLSLQCDDCNSWIADGVSPTEINNTIVNHAFKFHGEESRSEIKFQKVMKEVNDAVNFDRGT